VKSRWAVAVFSVDTPHEAVLGNAIESLATDVDLQHRLIACTQ